MQALQVQELQEPASAQTKEEVAREPEAPMAVEQETVEPKLVEQVLVPPGLEEMVAAQPLPSSPATERTAAKFSLQKE